MEPAEKKSSLGKVLGIGCLVVVLILGVGGYLVVKNFAKISRSLGANAMATVARQMIAESGLPAEDQTEIMKPILDLSKEIKAGAVSMDQMGKIIEALTEGPLASLVTVKAVEIKYLEPSGLSESEKTEGRLALSRFAEACVRNKANANDHSDELGSIVTTETTDSSGERTTQLKDHLTDAEVREVIAIMKRSADRAGIPNENFKVDIAAAISEAIAKSKQP